MNDGDQPMTGDGFNRGTTDGPADAHSDPHAAYRQQAAAHFGDMQDAASRSVESQPAGHETGARAPRLFRPTDDATQGITTDDATTQTPTAATPGGQGLPPNSSPRFGAGTTYTGRGPQQPAPPSPPAYVAPPSPPGAAPPASPIPPSPPNWQASSPYAAPPPGHYPPAPLSSLPAMWQRFNDAIDRLLLRGANGELLRQPWFDSIRHQNADLFVYLSYGAALVVSLILGAGTASTAVMILLWGLWAGLAYLYIAVNTRLARQFLEYGICLVAAVVSVGTALSALGTLFGDGLSRGYPTAIAEGLFGLIFSVATGLFFGVVGLRVHQAVPLPPPAAGPGATPQPPHQFTMPIAPNPAGAPPGPPRQANMPGGVPGSPWPPAAGGPQVPYPAFTGGGGGTAVAAAVLSFIGVIWFGIGAIGAAQMLAGAGQLMSTYNQLGLKVGWPFYEVVALSVVQIVIPICLLIGGIQLLSRRLAGRRTITLGCALLLASTAVWVFAFVGAAEWLNAWTAGFGAHAGLGVTSMFAKAGLFWAGAPAVFAIITMICALSPSTRQWCRPPGGAYGTPWYGPPVGP